MNSRIFYLAGLALALAKAPAAAQLPDISQTGAAAQANLNTLTTGAPTMLPHGTSEGTIGSPYVENRWLPARLILSNNVVLNQVPLKYDVLSQRLIMHKPAPSLDSLQLDGRLIARFVLQQPLTSTGPERQRLFRRFVEAPLATQRTDFVEVLHEGRYTLLKHYAKTLKKAALVGAYNMGDRHDEIEDKITYYLVSPTATPAPVKLSLRPLQMAAPGLASQLKSAVTTRNPKTELDWALVLDAADPQLNQK